MGLCLVFDIGKTHIKWHILDSSNNSVSVEQIENEVDHRGLFPSFDVDKIWQSFLGFLNKSNVAERITSICVTTHGATAALIDRNREDNGLVFPIMDYEFQGVEEYDADFSALRPHFSETGSPALPAGLNLGRQLFWLQHTFPEQFAQATDILMYPQYWAWRLTGHCVGEVSSLGCHTDLWQPWKRDYSSLVYEQNWLEKFPAIKNAWDSLGAVRSDIQASTGLRSNCEVFVGVHDSNASYLRYKRAMNNKAFCVISTGTWSIVMNSSEDASDLLEEKDMLANVDVWGKPVICSRFMGGREYAVVCEFIGGKPNEAYSEENVERLISQDVFCLPCWQSGTGPFSGENPEIVNPKSAPIKASALASLYCALVLDYQLDLVAANTEVILTGAFIKNTLLCEMLAQIRGAQPVFVSTDDTGTVLGAKMLSHWEGQVEEKPDLTELQASRIQGLLEYKAAWRNRLKV